MAHRSEFPSTQELIPGQGALQARIVTSDGAFTVELHEADCPRTVANFVGLASGGIDWIDPRSGELGEGPYYDGVTFHRIIEGFMLQGGDRTGTGRGGPGYTFDDECSPKWTHDRAGVLSMLNAGRRGPRGTNGSQFFITLRETPHLDGKHTVFGRVIEGLDVVQRISRCPTDREDRPLREVVIERIDVARSIP